MFQISAITPQQDSVMRDIIMEVGREFGAVGEGYGTSDAEVLALSQHYRRSLGSLYLIAQKDGRVVGGGGIGSFQGSSEICDLRKLFLLPEARGFGLGELLTQECLTFAIAQGYSQCYLESLLSMKSALGLYSKLGFTQLDQPLPGSEHGKCDIWMLKDLGPVST